MPLRDHFQPPLSLKRSWTSFHAFWANSIAAQLNQTLPCRFFAEAYPRPGSKVEADVVEFDGLDESEETLDDTGDRVAVAVWAPPFATMTMPAIFPDDMEVHVRDQLFDARVAAVVELVSPRNKDCPESRVAFAAKSGAYLERGIGLITLDIVTNQSFNLHNELLPILGLDSTYAMSNDVVPYAMAYRPIRRDETNQIDVWPVELSVGGSLPLLPLALKRFRPVRLDLEAAYEEACRWSRL